MGTEVAVPAVLLAALAVAALGALSIWLRVREVVAPVRSAMAREPNFWFWSWQIIKLLIVVGALWVALTLAGLLWR